MGKRRANRIRDKIDTAFIWLAILLAVSVPAATAAENNLKDGLRAVWEEKIHTHPETAAFEKLDKDRYRLETGLLPYKGEIGVHFVIDYDPVYTQDEGFLQGYADVKLLEAEEDSLISDYPRTYGLWSQLNLFYYDKDAEEWLSFADYNRRQAGTGMEICPLPGTFDRALYAASIGLLVLLIAAIILRVRMARKVQAMNNVIIERQKKALETAEETLAVQKKILAVLRKE